MRKKLLLLLALAIINCGSAQTKQSLNREASTNHLSLVQQPNASPIDQVTTVGKFKLSLDECQLTYEGLGKSGTASFEFPGRCQFSRDSKGEIRVVKTGRTETLLVESSREASFPKGSQTKDCLTYIRGVIVSAKEVRLSSQTQRVAQCLPAVWDEKMFRVFAAKTQSLSNPLGSRPQP